MRRGRRVHGDHDRDDRAHCGGHDHDRGPDGDDDVHDYDYDHYCRHDDYLHDDYLHDYDCPGAARRP
ncbi:MAG: hypothetical protein WAS51_07710 [Ilumatobacteraceae bacterium]|nr:MAG: hypothetical protein IPM43_10745 [Actinomycetota bacterium]